MGDATVMLSEAKHLPCREGKILGFGQGDNEKTLVERPRGQRGVALVEFVMVLPVLVMLLFGVWEFGRIFDAWQVATNAAREGARYAVAGSTDTGVITVVTDYLEDSYGGRLKSVNGTTVNAGGDVATEITVSHPDSEQVQVVVTAAVDIWAPVVAPLMGGSAFTVGAWSTMRE